LAVLLENVMSMALSELSRRALSDLSGVFSALPDTAADPLIEAIASARRIALYGAGREGLALRGFAMRLFHMGRDAHVVADMTTPPIGKGDLMIVTAGQGWLPTAETFMTIAKEAGATTAIITSQPDGQASQMADIRVVISAQTMANDIGATVSVLPMGSLFEIAETIFFELVVLKLRERFGETAETMRERHTNLE
jgi:6-phospho-3-hexuloisomerase